MTNLKISWLNWMPPIAAIVSPIQAQAMDYLNLEQAQKQMFPEASQFVPIDLTLNDAQKKEIENHSGVRVLEKKLKIWRVLGPKLPLGFLVVDEVLGKHEYITYAIALKLDRSVRSIEVMRYLETYGHEIRNEQWRKQFYGKSSSAPLKLGNDIQNVSGATLSCRHLTDGVKRILQTFETAIPKG